MLIELIFCIGLSTMGGPEFLHCRPVTAKGQRCPTSADLHIMRHAFLKSSQRNNTHPRYRVTGTAHVDLVACAMPDTAT